MDIQSFLYRRFARWITCTFTFSESRRIKLSDKHSVTSFQDVFVNPFYWNALFTLDFVPMRVFDLGANMGFFSILCAKFFRYKGWELPAFVLVEANPIIISKLKRNLEIFHIDSCKVFQAAIGPKEEQIDLYVNNKSFLSSSIYSKSSGKGLKVDCINPNRFNFGESDLVKIDIEGAEYEMLDNYFDDIAKVGAIIIEFHNFDKKINDEYIGRLMARGFRTTIYHLDEGTGYSLVVVLKRRYNQ